jgi:hypothetical protein
MNWTATTKRENTVRRTELLAHVYLPRDLPAWPWAVIYGVCALLEGVVLLLTAGLVDVDLPAMWVEVTNG